MEMLGSPGRHGIWKFRQRSALEMDVLDLQPAIRQAVFLKQEIDPDMIVTTCSSCYLQFDSAQKVLREKGEIDFAIPVFYYTQLLALCMGSNPSQVAAVSETPRDDIIERIQSAPRSIH